MARLAFRDSITGVLKSHGFVNVGAPGEVMSTVADDFNLTPGLWKWDGVNWISFVPFSLPTPITDRINATVGLTPELKTILLALAKGQGT